MGRVVSLGRKKYRLIADLGYRAGKRLRKTKTVTAKNVTEAKKMLAIFESQLGGNIDIYFGEQRDINLGQFYSKWNENYAIYAYGPRTLDEYRKIIKNRILPTFENSKVKDITELDVVHFFTDLQQNGKRLDGKEGQLSSSSVHNIFKAFTALLKMAVEWKIIEENPCNVVKLPSLEHEKGNPYDEEEVSKLLKDLESYASPRNQLITQIALVSGARAGEIAALETKHLNPKVNTIVIEQSLSLKEGQLILKSTKNKRIREVAIPENLMKRLLKQKLLKQTQLVKLGKNRHWPENQFLFSNESGKPLRPDSISQFWGRFRKRTNLREIRFHDLRHTSATILINRGTHAKVIQERLGHSTIGTTMNVYGHVLQKADQDSASHFEMLLEGKENK